ncbi:Proton-dependent oligopeptide transporter family [Arabidopsis thaliana x Arabidopsis arenosa]|uniref:Proton-dependent oligopeptide transporter family n=1 Tax=Arabidopsis thaliana x Arabidopsis arenosa TaxID=1240361 RepID=A0A8T2C119_9BRAS|nr:Proton-dependent oligopeptide transporter family [Arabidopsis thaliana x Arabidopsis arenosa]
MAIAEEEAALIEDSVSDSVDHRGLPAGKSSTGGWRSAWYIIGVEVGERFAYFGIASNLITYLTGPLGQSTATAAVNVNTWSGTASMLPVLGAFIADAYLGRYRTIVVASLIYILGLGLLTLSSILILMRISEQRNDASPKPLFWVNILFFCSLYLVAIGQGGHKPCVQAFGADQFDVEDPKERISRGSFFNWWFLSLSAGITLSIIVVVYVQDNVNWALGFGIPCLFMVMALALFLLGRKTYRYPRRDHEEKKNAFARIGRVFLVAFKNRKLKLTHSGQLEDGSSKKCKGRLEFLAKALLSGEGGAEPCSSSDVEDAMALVRLIPIWITSVVSTIPYAQYATFFTKQGVTVDRKILPGLEIPPASFQALIGLSIFISVPTYERIFLPLARLITKKPSGITMLQRIGAGMVLSSLNMVVAALVEMKRLEMAKEHGLVDRPDATIPMSIWWFVPQYLLLGMIDVFSLVGTQEFFYDQVPTELRSIGLALSLSAMGLASFLSGFLITVINWATGKNGGDSWFNTNLNRAHVDYFYWLLAAFTAIGFLAFLFFSRLYVYRRVDQI